ARGSAPRGDRSRLPRAGLRGHCRRAPHLDSGSTEAREPRPGRAQGTREGDAMTDFVTRLETELHAAAQRQEKRGRVRGATLPRLRIALGDLPAAAVAVAALALVVAVSAALLSLSPPERTAGGLPPQLSGVWRAAPTELRLYEAGAQRCADLGLGSSAPCYALGDSGSHVATDWGGLSRSGDTLLLRSKQGAGAGIYRWRLRQGRLQLTKVSDPNRNRVRALVAMPFAFVE